MEPYTKLPRMLQEMKDLEERHAKELYELTVTQAERVEALKNKWALSSILNQMQAQNRGE